MFHYLSRHAKGKSFLFWSSQSLPRSHRAMSRRFSSSKSIARTVLGSEDGFGNRLTQIDQHYDARRGGQMPPPPRNLR
jgi:hypothetical protein